MVETANDGAYSYSWTFLWNVNGAVTLTPPADQTNYEGDTVSLSVAGTDSGGTPAYTAIGLPPGLRINAGTGLITGTVAAGASAYGPYTVTVYANDGTNGAEETFTWTVNDPVEVVQPADQVFSEGQSVDLQIAASAPSGTLSYSAFDLPLGLSINAATGAITGTIVNGIAAAGNFVSTVVVRDGIFSDAASLSWSVLAPALGLGTVLFEAPAAGGFDYKVVGDPNFGGAGAPIGYKQRLDIAYQTPPAHGSFIQVNTITTIVVTIKDGKLTATPKVSYKVDRKKLLAGETSYHDTVGGPSFDKDLAPDAVLVFSHVTKEQGYTRGNFANLKGTAMSKDEAAAINATMQTNLGTGSYQYSYLWENAAKAKDVAKLQDALLDSLDQDAKDLLSALIKSQKLDLGDFKGQLLAGDSGLEKKADLDGKDMD